MTPDPRVHLDLTLTEASALISAASEVMNHDDVVEENFSGTDRAAARRAYSKLLNAYSKAAGA